MSNFPNDGRLEGDVERGEPVTVVVDGVPMRCFRGESVATALLATGRRTLRLTSKLREPRGLFCAMGVCYDCLVSIDGGGLVRGCMVSVEEGMVITTGTGTDTENPPD
jgi:predicted molibdopterin-dependent oxidoreductase YjgC